MYDELVVLRDALKDIDGVCSCKIGIESGISPADFPLIRLVPNRFVPGDPYNSRTAEVSAFFGWNTTNAEGLEQVYSDVLVMEEEIIKTIKAQDCRYIETITDDDRIESYKLMRITFEMRATRPTVP